MSSSPLVPASALLSPHAGLIYPPSGGGSSSSQAHPPSSPLPHMFEADDEPPRSHHRTATGGDGSVIAAATAAVSPDPPLNEAAAAASASEGLSIHLSPQSCSDGSMGRERASSASSSLSQSFSSMSVKSATKKVLIFSCPEMSDLAADLVKLDERFALAQVKWCSFADGWPNIFIERAECVKKHECVFLANFHSPAVFFEQFSVITALPKLLPKSFKLILPFFPTGTMERVSRLGEVATANTLARILSTVPSCSKGPAQICIFDIHALQNQFYFKDTVLIRLGTCVNLLLERIASLPDRSNVNIAFPDDGAAKRFGDMFSDYAAPIICHKIRDGSRRVVKLKEGDVHGRHCIIVDDLVQSGGTMLECAKELLRNGAESVSAYVTHAIFPKDSFKQFLHEEQPQGQSSPFKHFWVTDTNPPVANRLRGRAPFEVLSIAQNIREIILDEEKQL